MALIVTHAGITDRGRVRERNEDNWAADPDQGLFIVSDGLGGHFAGDLASKIVVEALPPLLREKMESTEALKGPKPRKLLLSALRDLSNQLRDNTDGEPGLEGMGATVVLALIRRERALLAHMGDSRAYLLRRRRLRQLTKDHSMVQLLIDSGDLSPEEAVEHSSWGMITRSVGMEGEPLPEAKLIDLCAGDRLLLCSDGLVRMLDDEKILSMLADVGSVEQISRRLIDAANDAGGEDNVTVLVIDLELARTESGSNQRARRP